jgi:TolA-binding protein
MVKVGLCQRMLRQDEEARRTFNAVMLTYPDSQAAAVAMKLLGEMP